MRLARFGIVALCVSSGVAAASSFSFTGAFSQDDQLQIFLFTAPTVDTLVRTWSYAGGTNAAGTVIPAGGFDPVLSVFDATGGLTSSSPLVAFNDDGPTCPTNSPECVSTDPATGLAADSLLALNGLDPGHTYAVVLSESFNYPNGSDFGSGFSQAGTGNFTAVFFPCGGTAFCDAGLNQRDGNWAVDITGVGTAVNTSVPEPGSILLLTAGLACLAILRRNGKQV